MAGWPWHKFRAVQYAYRLEAARVKRAIQKAKGEETWDWDANKFERPR